MTYELKSVNLPRLTGAGLKIFTALVENPATAALLMGNLMETGGINKFRKLKVNEPPTVYPLVQSDSRGTATPLDLEAIAQTDSPTRSAGFRFATVNDYATAYRLGSATPEGVAGRVIDAIKDSDSGPNPLRAFIAVNPDDVLRQARDSGERIKAGKSLSIIDGVPVAIKDEVDMVPYPTTVGTKFLGGAPARIDSTVVARLRAAGALLVGKANMHEIGINPVGFNAHYGVTRNPYDPRRYPGGSSSGSAAAVAAGLCPVAIGADGGGSIRIPAALCGIVGLKATFGRVSELGAAPLTWTMGHLGPLAATVADAALAYAIIAGPDSNDATTLVQPPVTLDGFGKTDLRGLTFGVFRPWLDHATPEIVSACNAALKTLESLGATIREIEIPELDSMRIAHAVTILSEMASALEQHRAAHNSDHGLDVRINLAIGRACTSRDYVQAQRVRTRAMAHFANALKEVNAIVTPSTAITAPPIRSDVLPDGESDLNTVTELMRFVIPGNLVGLPGISVPVGYDSNGLPIGLQVMGAHWSEGLLLRVAQAIEGTIERKKPEVHYNILEK
ncbi:MAG TPA: amidase [Anaerolineales bacterium]|nr:amidase [Anaerolineales bacterium]